MTEVLWNEHLLRIMLSRLDVVEICRAACVNKMWRFIAECVLGVQLVGWSGQAVSTWVLTGSGKHQATYSGARPCSQSSQTSSEFKYISGFSIMGVLWGCSNQHAARQVLLAPLLAEGGAHSQTSYAASMGKVANEGAHASWAPVLACCQHLLANTHSGTMLLIHARRSDDFWERLVFLQEDRRINREQVCSAGPLSIVGCARWSGMRRQSMQFWGGLAGRLRRHAAWVCQSENKGMPWGPSQPLSTSLSTGHAAGAAPPAHGQGAAAQRAGGARHVRHHAL